MIVKTPTCSQSPEHKHIGNLGQFVVGNRQGSFCICNESWQKAGIALQINIQVNVKYQQSMQEYKCGHYFTSASSLILC